MSAEAFNVIRYVIEETKSTDSEVMAELKANGSEQTRKTYRNAGLRGEMFGVSYAFLKKLHKRVKVDHALALALWETNILDARIFACWVADADKTTVKLLETWARDDGEPLRVTIPMPERELKAAVFRMDVGRVPLYLLDTRIPENDPGDQDTTFRLYPSEREPRLRQEILLGMGGWRALRALGATPEI